MAATYPHVYAGVGVHSGLVHGAVCDTGSAFAAMSNGPATAHPPQLSAIPLMVIHGDSDPAVNHLNADRLVEMALGWNGDRATHHHTDTDGHVPGGRHYTRTDAPGSRSSND